MRTAAKELNSITSTGALFGRKLNVSIPTAVSGKGVWIFDEHNNGYLDAAGGCAVVNVGHGVTEIAEAIGQQAETLAYVNGTQFTNVAAEGLADALAPHLSATVPDPRCYFLSTGSEAVEAAIKFARQVWVERGKPGKWQFISRRPSYHGNTLAGLSLSAREHYKTAFLPLLLPFEKILAPLGEGEDLQLAEALEAMLLKLGPENVAAFIAEPIGGSSTAATVPDLDYWPKVRKICNRYDVLLIADEVMCGMGRTGRWLASEHFGLQADIVTLGKGINGGYAPLSAMVASGELVAEIAQGSGQFLHAGTYSHTPVMCAAGLATVQYLEKHQLVERSAEMGNLLHNKLLRLKQFSSVGKIQGRGLFAGIEFLDDPALRKPFQRNRKFIEKLVAEAFQNGLIVWPNVGHVDGDNGDLIILAPPFTITEDEIELLVAKLSESITAVENQL